MKALAAMRGPSSFTAVELCKCQHQTVVDLVDLAGMESLVVPALKAVQVAQILVLRAGETTGLLVRAVMTTVRPALVEMMIARVVGLVGMMRVHVFVGMMIVLRVRDVTVTVRPALVVMMIARVVGLVGMMRVPVSVETMIVQRVHVAMTLVQPGPAPQLSSERMRFVTRVVVAG